MKRRHFTQMTNEEIRALIVAVRARSYSWSQHALDRMTEKRISGAQISAVLSYGSIVELHNEVSNELRVLVRGKVKGVFVCVVVSLTTNEIVTAYVNRAGDYHQTLDHSQYGWSITAHDALKLFKC